MPRPRRQPRPGRRARRTKDHLTSGPGLSSVTPSMLDISFIRQNQDAVRAAIKNKRVDLDLDVLLQADKERREIIATIEAKRARKNEIARLLLQARFTITDRRYIGYEDDTGYHHYAIDISHEYKMEEE